MAFAALAPDAKLPGTELLTDRLRLVGRNEATRILRASDGWVAITLARDDDVASVPAIVEGIADDPWQALTAWAQSKAAAEVADRAQLLGVPAGVVDSDDEQLAA